ncbi:F12F1.11-RELATED [Salix viminalis]|uniref:F12F1.11-RELATED n=1 Tax=Salix viminalis TaxID=40686 RepID=A0A6N2NH02_SALVM|nr:F12F1.11-RELATED [Salix viminalis]
MHKREGRAAVFMLAKKMKVERKGKAYPSQPSASSLSSSKSSYKDPDSVLKLLPVTILALALSLPNQDREVLAYLIARSILITTAPNPSSLVTQHPKSKCKTKSTANTNEKFCDQKVHFFQCGCFDCYTVFWYRWDSSPNRDFIHQVIEAFEEHLVQKIESSKKQSRGRKKGKVLTMGHFESDNILLNIPQIAAPKTECEVMIMQEHLESGEIEENEVVYEEEMVSEEVTSDLEMEVVTGHASGYDDSNQKGLSRKVLPDAMGLLISRLWSNLWSPGM